MILSEDMTTTLLPDLFKYNISSAVVLPTHKNIHESDGGAALQAVWTLIDIILFLAITGGNALTITAILRRPLVVSNLFVLSLSCSDLIVGLMQPYHMAFYLEPHLGDSFPHCIVRLSLISLACIASMFNILGIAADRFISIVVPLHYHKIMTYGMAYTVVSGSWLAAFVIATAPVYWNKWTENTHCQVGLVVEPLYILAIYVPIFSLLFVTMCGVYAKILCEAWRQAEKIYSPTRWKSVQVLMLVMGSFSVSYCPFFIVSILTGVFQMNSLSPELYKVTTSLAMANSAVNPIIYTWKNHEFKNEILRLISCRGWACKLSLPGVSLGHVHSSGTPATTIL